MGYFNEQQIKQREATVFKSLCPRCHAENKPITLDQIRAAEGPHCFSCGRVLKIFNPIVEEKE